MRPPQPSEGIIQFPLEDHPENKASKALLRKVKAGQRPLFKPEILLESGQPLEECGTRMRKLS
jgi:hypothetical protein